jgi:hypothetical protein
MSELLIIWLLSLSLLQDSFHTKQLTLNEKMNFERIQRAVLSFLISTTMILLSFYIPLKAFQVFR